MKKNGARCLADLRKLGVQFRRAHRRPMIATPVIVPDMTFGHLTLAPTYRKPPFVMDCRLARALARYGGVLTALGIRQLRFSSIYDYRRVRLHHRVKNTLSRHALGLAIDVFGVDLFGGHRLVVQKDYWSLNPTLILADIALRLSGGFRLVLSPATDPDSHHDHIHIEAKVEPLPRRHRRRRHHRRHHHRRAIVRRGRRKRQ